MWKQKQEAAKFVRKRKHFSKTTRKQTQKRADFTQSPEAENYKSEEAEVNLEA